MLMKQTFKTYQVVGGGVLLVIVLILAAYFTRRLPAQTAPQDAIGAQVMVAPYVSPNSYNQARAVVVLKDSATARYGQKRFFFTDDMLFGAVSPLPIPSGSLLPSNSPTPSASVSPDVSPSGLPNPSPSATPSPAASASPSISPSVSPSPASWWSQISFPDGNGNLDASVYVKTSQPNNINMNIENIDPADVECVAVEFNQDPCGTTPFAIQPLTNSGVPVCQPDQLPATRIRPSICPTSYPYPLP